MNGVERKAEFSPVGFLGFVGVLAVGELDRDWDNCGCVCGEEFYIGRRTGLSDDGKGGEGEWESGLGLGLRGGGLVGVERSGIWWDGPGWIG